VTEICKVEFMTRNVKLTGRVREVFSGTPNLEEKSMFGGVAFMVNGKLCVSVRNSRIMCRVNPAKVGELKKMKGCRIMRMGGREYKGYVLVDEKALGTRRELNFWVGAALDFNRRIKATQMHSPEAI
jgi:TfoX/Sxy family transcriptional regulator of competence genes